MTALSLALSGPEFHQRGRYRIRNRYQCRDLLLSGSRRRRKGQYGGRQRPVPDRHSRNRTDGGMHHDHAFFFWVLFTAEESVVSMGTRYCSIAFLFTVVIVTGVSFEKIFQATGRMKATMAALMAGCIANIILDTASDLRYRTVSTDGHRRGCSGDGNRTGTDADHLPDRLYQKTGKYPHFPEISERCGEKWTSGSMP